MDLVMHPLSKKYVAISQKSMALKSATAQGDMLKVDEIELMIKTAENEFGAVDVLVNNAGIQHVSPVEDFPVDKWNAIIAINLSASFHTIRVALPKMKAKGWGADY
jgi:3-hydroxybutyrate dehydrogenase